MALGDHLLVERKGWFFDYYHHGIDVGDDRVIHLTGPRKSEAKVVETSLEEFLQGGKKEIWEYVTFIDLLRNYHRDMQSDYGRPHWVLPLLDEERIAEIESRIADSRRAVAEARKRLGGRGYDLFGNNCEHFAVYCKTGLAVSLQVIIHVKQSDRIFKIMTRRRCDHLGM